MGTFEIKLMSIKKIKISEILITKNEEKNIKRCLDSINFIDDIVLVDSGSQDKTLEIAGSYKNVRVFKKGWEGFSINKNYAISKTQNDWLFWIDADEELSTELKNFLIDYSAKDKVQAYSFKRKNFFLGSWVKHSGWYPNRVVRFFNKKNAKLDGSQVHETIILSDSQSLKHLDFHLFHYSYTSLFQYFLKMLNYGKVGAIQLKKKRKFKSPFMLLLGPAFTFMRFYFLRRGFQDGLVGLIVCIGAAFSNFIKYSYYVYYSHFEKDLEQDE